MCPEKSEVQVISDQVHKLVVGKTLIDVKHDTNSRYSKSGIPGFQHLKFPYICIDVKSKGKKIIFTLEDLDKVQVFLLSFLGLEGKWLTTPGKHSNLWLEFEDFKLYFHDSRHFGLFTVYPDKISLDSFIKRTTGPDLLNDDITLEEWTKKIKNPRIKNKHICLFLLDQKQFSGIGVYQRAEILYACKIKPTRPLCELTNEEIEMLLKVSKEKIRESYEANGLTIRTYLAPDGSKGEFKQIIYGKQKDPYGNNIIKEKDKTGRMNHWVPEVQK